MSQNKLRNLRYNYRSPQAFQSNYELILHFSSITSLGSASNVAVMVGTEHTLQSADCKALISGILQTKEYDEIEQRIDDSSSGREHRIQGLYVFDTSIIILR